MLPHEAWLSKRFGLERSVEADSSPPVAVAAMQAHGLPCDPGHWFLVQPVHIHIARDHLVLTDLRPLSLPEPESQALYAAAKPLFEEAGRPLAYGDATTWFVRADDWADLRTATPDAASGHNIDIWMPKGSGERAWRKLQNEVQMHWHIHAINMEREMRGAKPVNSLWLWGGASSQADALTSPYAKVFNLTGWMDALGRHVPQQAYRCSAADVIDTAAEHRNLVILDSLIPSAFAQDWAEWLHHMQGLDTEWLSPLMHALKSGKIDQLTLILTHNTGLSEFTINRNSLRKFWIKPSFANLAR